MKFAAGQENMIKEIKDLQSLLSHGPSLKNCTFQDIDFRDAHVAWQDLHFDNTSFLGCQFSAEEEQRLRDKGAFIFPRPQGLPYQPFRKDLYHWAELMVGYKTGKSTDLQIYEHFSISKFNPNINEALCQRIHDHAIDDALRDLIGFDAEGMSERKCVGFMGGHSTLRTDPFYEKTAFTAKLLCEHGYYIVSGGGPGIMEATNLGAYFGGKSDSDLVEALQLLQKAPHYTHEGYHEAAVEVLERFPKGAENLAIPTWFYGHEPSNLFASHIAKYFSNSIREDTLLAISLYGIICAPGSAGTTQEIFMDATQNHYGTFNYYSPMIFLGKERYEIQISIFPLLKQLSWGRTYHDLLFLTDEPMEILDFLRKHPPIKVS